MNDGRESAFLLKQSNGVRYRGKRAVDSNGIRSRNPLFKGYVPKPKTSEEMRKLEGNRRSATFNEMHRASLEEQALRAEETKRIEATGDIMKVATDNLQKQTKEIGRTTKETLSVSKATLNISKKTFGAIKAGLAIKGGPSSYIMNPWVALMTSYILHPYFPVSTETIMPLWGIIISAGYVVKTVPQILRGEGPITLSGSMLGTTRSLVLSQPHAIFLLFNLSRMWTEDRLGITDPEAAIQFKQVMQSSDLEPFVFDRFKNVLQGIQELNLRAFNITVADAPSSFNMTDLQARLSTVHDSIYDEIVAMNPEMWKDKAGCIQVVTEYLAGKLVIATGDTIKALGVPGHLYQFDTFKRAEWYLIECIFNLTKQIFYETGKKFLNTTQQFICSTLCAFAQVKKATKEETSWLSWANPVNHMQSAAEFLVSMACDCGKIKMDGGFGTPVVPQGDISYNALAKLKRDTGRTRKRRRSSKMQKSRKGSRRGVTFKSLYVNDHAAFQALTFNYTMYSLAPFFGIPLNANSPSYKSLEREMARIFEHKLETGQFVPPFYFEDFNVLTEYPKLKAL